MSWYTFLYTLVLFFFKQKTAYEMRISDWSSDVCSSDLPHVVVASPSLPANTLAELTKLAKDQPDSINFGSAGVGSFVHMIGELYKMESSAPITHIHYKGNSAALNDLLGGQIDLLIQNIPTVISYVQTSTQKTLALTGEKHAAHVP